MDPAEISALPHLAEALDRLRRERSLSLQGLADAAKRLPARGGRQQALPRSTASDLLNAKSVPEAETVSTFLAACGVREEEDQRPWLQALERVAIQHQWRPRGTVRVRDARPRMLGVHAAIQAAQPFEHAQGDLPPYVPRDFDPDLRAKLILAGQQGGFVLLSGDSSAGKTRALCEAAQTVLPDWWLLHPRDAEAVREFAGRPAGRTVVWLDELQDYLDFAGGVSAGQVRELIAAGVVLVATCWPGEYGKRVALPEKGRPDRYANDRRLLGLADVLHVPAAFSTPERHRAEDLAGTDRRIRVALDTPDAGFTQVMAAGPELIRHWDQAPVYARAVITAALDARRVGAHAPLTRSYLADAAPGYLAGRDMATAPPDWLEDALPYASRLLRGATAALTPVPAGMGAVAGYQVADYLHQHALHTRRGEPLPDTAWDALVRHHHPDDTGRLADNAERRGRDGEAVTLYRRLADRGDEPAARHLAWLLAERGQVEQLRARADAGDSSAAHQLAGLLAERGQVEQLRARVGDGDGAAADRLAGLLVRQRKVEHAIELLRPHADKGDRDARLRLIDLLAAQGLVAELRARADAGDRTAADRLAGVLAGRGQVEDAIRLLRPRADSGDGYAAHRLAGLLAGEGRVEEALRLLRPHADGGDRFAGHRIVELLIGRGQVEDVIRLLSVRADSGDDFAADRLAGLLAGQGRLEELRLRVDGGDRFAARRVADLLVEQGRLEELRFRADGGEWSAAHRLAGLLAEQGRLEELRVRADNDDESAAHRLADVLVKEGRIEDAIQVLRPRTDRAAVHRVADLLAAQGRLEEVLQLLHGHAAESDHGPPSTRVTALLVEGGHLEEVLRLLRPHADNGHGDAARRLVGLLSGQGKVEELQREVAAGTAGAVAALRHLRSG